MPSITRRKSVVFVDPVEDNRSICQACYEEGYITKLVEYKPDPLHYKACPFCGNIADKNSLRFESTTQPLGYSGGVKQKVSFEVVSGKRSRSGTKDRDIFKVEDYPLAEKLDEDLKHFANSGIILSIQDEGVE